MPVRGPFYRTLCRHMGPPWGPVLAVWLRMRLPPLPGTRYRYWHLRNGPHDVAVRALGTMVADWKYLDLWPRGAWTLLEWHDYGGPRIGPPKAPSQRQRIRALVAPLQELADLGYEPQVWRR